MCSCLARKYKLQGDSLTFGTGMPISSNFPDPQIIRPTIENTLDTKKMAWIMTYYEYQTLYSLAHPNFKPQIAYLGPRNFRPQIAHLGPRNFRTQIAHLIPRNFRSQIAHLGPRNFRPQIILPTPNCKPHINTLTPPFQKSRSSSPGNTNPIKLRVYERSEIVCQKYASSSVIKH